LTGEIISEEKIADNFVEIGFEIFESGDFTVYISHIKDIEYYHIELFKNNDLGGGRQYLVDGYTGEIFWTWGTE